MPSRLADVARNVKRLGGEVDKPRSGSHWRVYRSDGRMFPLPAHNGPKSELSDVYLRELAAFLGVEVAELKR